jgi:hypothetical protein
MKSFFRPERLVSQNLQNRLPSNLCIKRMLANYVFYDNACMTIFDLV